MNGLSHIEMVTLRRLRWLAEADPVAAKKEASVWIRAAAHRCTIRRAACRTVAGLYAHLKDMPA